MENQYPICCGPLSYQLNSDISQFEVGVALAVRFARDISIKQNRRGEWTIVAGGVKGFSQGPAFYEENKNVSGQLKQRKRTLGMTPPLWHMQHPHNELYYNYNAQSVEVDKIDIWPWGAECTAPACVSIQITLTQTNLNMNESAFVGENENISTRTPPLPMSVKAVPRCSWATCRLRENSVPSTFTMAQTESPSRTTYV